MRDSSVKILVLRKWCDFKFLNLYILGFKDKNTSVFSLKSNYFELECFCYLQSLRFSRTQTTMCFPDRPHKNQRRADSDLQLLQSSSTRPEPSLPSRSTFFLNVYLHRFETRFYLLATEEAETAFRCVYICALNPTRGQADLERVDSKVWQR